MLKRNAVATAIASLLMASAASAVTLYENENGDYLKLYGEVGVGGDFGTKEKFKQYHSNDSFIDDSMATLGAMGKTGIFDYRVELDYERENWRGGSGDMVLHIDKAWLGYRLNQNHYVEFGLTDTAFDDYDAFGDLTLDRGADLTGEAGDQDRTIKYEGKYQNFALGVSYSYRGESSSGAALGNITNGYLGYFGEQFSLVLGAEKRNGSAGESKYGEARIYGLGARYSVTENILLGINGFIEFEDLGECTTTSDPWVEQAKMVCNRYQEFENKGGVVSLQYSLNEHWDLVGSVQYEEYQAWDRDDQDKWGKDQVLWEEIGKSRTFQTLGVRYKPNRSSAIEIEGYTGESYQNVYAKASVFF